MTTIPRPCYIDGVTGNRYDPNNGNFEGWLNKQSTWIKDWRKRYFILKGSYLFFSKDEAGLPHGMIDLSLCLTVKSADMKCRKKHSIEVSTADTTYLMYAESEKEKDEWIGAIGRAIVQASATFTGDDGVDRENPGGSDDEEDS